MTTATSHPGSRCYLQGSYRSLSELLDHIVRRHHAYLRKELPRLSELATRCIVARSSNPVGVAQDLRQILAVLTQELALMMLKEEAMLFPWIRRLESADCEQISAKRSLIAPIEMMQQEHRFVIEALDRLRWLANNYVPRESCGTEYHSLLAGLADLDADLRQHIREEDDLVFPRAMELESVALLHG